MRTYTIGIDDHYAWAALVSLETTGSTDVVLDRRRVELLEPPLAVSPYHHDALHLPLPQAEELARAVQASANRLAQSALSSLLESLAPARCVGIAIRVPPLERWPLPVSETVADTWTRNRADGMLYHHALTQAAAQLGLDVFHFNKDSVMELAAQTRGTQADALARQLKALGAPLGPPWRAGHVTACAGAILASASSTARA